MRCNVGSQASYVIPGLLWTHRESRRRAESVAGEKSTDVHLACGGVDQFVVAIAAVEVPLRTEVVVETGDTKVGSLRKRDVGFEADFVNAVATSTDQVTATGIIAGGLIGIPHLLDERVDAKSTRI